MGNENWMISAIKSLPEQSRHRIVEVGAGEGHLAVRLARAFPNARISALDLVPAPRDCPGVQWHQGDLFSLTEELEGALVVANLFLHHFRADQLARLGKILQNSTGLIASEPERRALHVWQGKLISPLIGEVTRHDLKVSVGAGFRDEELPNLLGLKNWSWKFKSTWTGAHRAVGVPK